MKKTYVKPAIAFESFALSQCIAASCNETTLNHSTAYTCSYQGRGDAPNPVFMVGMFAPGGVCSIGVSMDDFCYTNGAAEMGIFGS